MEVFHTRCCGLDVHKSSITACVRLHDGGGKPVYQDYHLFTTVASPHKFQGYDGGE